MATLPPGRAAAQPDFGDARNCKDWLNALPLDNIPRAQGLVLEALRALNASEHDAMARLTCLELMRDKVAFLQGEQRARYFGKSLPLSPNDSGAWATGLALLEEMEAGYRACLAAAEGEAMAPHRALLAQRVLRYLGAQMLFHALVYRRFDAALWTRLHGQFAEAERAGLEHTPVKDSLEAEAAGSSVEAAYLHVILLQAAFLEELTAPQIDFVDALLRQWIRKAALRPRGAASDAAHVHALAVDLDKPIGARPLAQSALAASHRVIDTGALSNSLRKRIHALENDAEPVSLGLPAETGVGDPLPQLRRLHKLWCEGAPPRPPGRVSQETGAGVVFGIAEAHFFVAGGKLFEQPDRPRELTREEKQDIEVFGQVTQRTQGRMMAEHNYTAENWKVVDEMLGAWRLQRPPTASRGVAIGRLVAMRVGDAGAFYLGVVSALVMDADGGLVMTVSLFPGRPQPIAVRAADPRRARNAWVPGFRLPPLERLQIAASFVVASGLAARGKHLEWWDGEPREVAVAQVLERGADFDRLSA